MFYVIKVTFTIHIAIYLFKLLNKYWNRSITWLLQIIEVFLSLIKKKHNSIPGHVKDNLDK